MFILGVDLAKPLIGTIMKLGLLSGIAILVLMGLATAATLAHVYCGQIVGQMIVFCVEIPMIVHYTALFAFILGFCSHLSILLGH